jgi:hypothetical protein
VFITFETIPRTLKDFDNLTKYWVGFPPALNQIGLKYDEVKKRLQGGKPPFENEEVVEKACEDALKR